MQQISFPPVWTLMVALMRWKGWVEDAMLSQVSGQDLLDLPSLRPENGADWLPG